MPLHIAIIGGGAAGFFAAIEAKRNYPDTDITIFEKNQKMLAKVAITGGGRCNLTNSFEQISDPKHAYPRGDKLMKRLFKRFDHHAAYAWFEREGVPLTTQEDECVFPVSQDAMSVVNCLTTLASRLGVKQLGGYQLKDISRNADGTFHLTFAGGKEADFDRVAIATGGAPKGEGLDVFARLDHDIATPVPSLFTFNIADRSFLTLMGTVVEDTIASLPGTKFRAEGPLLVTHWGMSGPAALKLSAHAARYLQEHNYQTDVAINWTGESRRNVTEEEIASIATRNPQKQLATIRPFAIAPVGLPAAEDAERPHTQVGRIGQKEPQPHRGSTHQRHIPHHRQGPLPRRVRDMWRCLALVNRHAHAAEQALPRTLLCRRGDRC